jgi:hypothetical protein
MDRMLDFMEVLYQRMRIFFNFESLLTRMENGASQKPVRDYCKYFCIESTASKGIHPQIIHQKTGIF